MYPPTTKKVLSYLGFVLDIDYELVITNDGLQLTWKSDSDKPTVEAIAAAELPAVKGYKLTTIRAEAKQRIESKWPDWLQRNIALGLDPDLAQSCADDIAAVRTASNAAEDAIKAATTVEEVEAVSASWPVL